MRAASISRPSPAVVDETKHSPVDDALSDDDDDDDELNLYEARIPVGKTYDTTDISVQLEGTKVFIHCHTSEPTDRRGNYRKYEFKTELLVPDVVDDESIVAYLTEQGELIVEGKYHPWAWKEIRDKQRAERQQVTSLPPTSNGPVTRHDGTGRLSRSRPVADEHSNEQGQYQ